MSEVKLIASNKVAAHKIKEDEAHLVHAELKIGQYDPVTGKPVGKAYVQIFDVKEWHNVLEHPNGLLIKPLHLPKGAMTVEEYEVEKKKRIEKAEKKSIK